MSDDKIESDAELTADIDSENDAALEPEESEEESESLEDTENAKEVQRQKTAQGQIDKAQQLLDKGEEIPDSLKWTLKHIEPKVRKPDDIKTSLREMLAEEKDIEKFDTLQKELKGLGLSKDEFAKVKSKYNLYQSKGFKKGEALNEALDIFSSKRVSAEERQKKKSTAAIPNAGQEGEEELSYDNFKTLSKDQKWELLKKSVSK